MASHDNDSEAMALIKSSGVLNPNMTMDKILELTQKLSAMSPAVQANAEGVAQALHTDTFIHSHFIYKHESK